MGKEAARRFVVMHSETGMLIFEEAEAARNEEIRSYFCFLAPGSALQGVKGELKLLGAGVAVEPVANFAAQTGYQLQGLKLFSTYKQRGVEIRRVAEP